MMNLRHSKRALSLVVIALGSIGALAEGAYSQSSKPSTISVTDKPSPAPARWLGLIGEYGPDDDILLILEKDGKLQAAFGRVNPESLAEVSRSVFRFAPDRPNGGKQIVFTRGANGRATQVQIAKTTYKWRQLGPEEGRAQLQVKPVRPVSELIKEAQAAKPPIESGEFLPSDLVEITQLDPTIKLDIRYATTNNLFGSVFYSQPRAFLQRPAAEAVVRIHCRLQTMGYGLLIYDAYRPWYVTRVFWDATPDDKKLFVADPAKGSRHNRGAAVDLTLYDLTTGRPVEMVATYDETTDRSYPNYPGGTSLQRWYRDLLRSVMEAAGFTVYEAEWWHFDYRDWQRFPIGNQVFEEIGGS